MSDAHPLVMARCIASPPTNRAVATNQALQRATLALAAVLYAWVLSRGTFDLLGAEPFGLTFNSMLAHMLTAPGTSTRPLSASKPSSAMA